MKFEGERGSVLIVATGILAVLVLLTISVTRGVNQQLLMVKYSQERMLARYAAWAGFHYALAMIREDSLDERGRAFDNMYECGFVLAEKETPQDRFSNISFGESYFSIRNLSLDEAYGFGDEDGKLNLNGLNAQNMGIMAEYLKIYGVADSEAQRIAGDIVDWKDEDALPAQSKDKESEGPYTGVGELHTTKNRPFAHMAELRYVAGIDDKIFEELAGGLTVFPRTGDQIKINFMTASRNVLTALARYLSGPQTNTSRQDADSLVAKMLIYRAGEDGMAATADDRAIDENKMALNASERVLLRAMAAFETKTSRFLALQVIGAAKTQQRKSRIDVVLDRENLSIVYWRSE